MRFIKILGSVAIAAVGAMALIGASAASAGGPEQTKWSTQLCDVPVVVETLECGTPTTEIHAIASFPLLHSSLVDVFCDVSLLKAKALSLGEKPNPQVIHLEELTWKNCETHGGVECSIETVLLGLFNILKLTRTDAHVVSTGGTVVNVKCGALIDCAYGGTPTLLELTANLTFGPHAGLLHADTTVENEVEHTGTFCPNTGTLLALYEALKDIYLGS